MASRARRRVQGATVPEADLARQQEVVDAFLAASRQGDFDALLALLDADVVLRADSVDVKFAASRKARGAPAISTEVRSARAVADTFSGRARAAQPALVDGAAGAVWAPGGQPRAIFGFITKHGKTVEINLVADPQHIRRLDLVILDD